MIKIYIYKFPFNLFFYSLVELNTSQTMFINTVLYILSTRVPFFTFLLMKDFSPQDKSSTSIVVAQMSCIKLQDALV